MGDESEYKFGPDPTPRTMETVAQAIENIKELRRQDKESSDKAIALLQSNADKSPTTAELKHMLVRLEDVFKAEIKRIDTQISERDDSVKEKLQDQKDQLASALASVDKFNQEQRRSIAEASSIASSETTRSIRSQEQLSQATNKATDDKINGQSARIATLEANQRFAVALLMATIAIAALVLQAWK